MRRVHRLRRHQRKNVVEVVLAKPRLVILGELFVARYGHPDAGELFSKLEPEALLFDVDRADHLLCLPDLLRGRTPVDGEFVHSGSDLLLQAADALHEELVEVRGGDRQELHTLEQRGSFVVRLVQDTVVEGQPGQLAVEVVLWRIEVELGPGLGGPGLLLRL